MRGLIQRIVYKIKIFELTSRPFPINYLLKTLKTKQKLNIRRLDVYKIAYVFAVYNFRRSVDSGEGGGSGGGMPDASFVLINVKIKKEKKKNSFIHLCRKITKTCEVCSKVFLSFISSREKEGTREKE